MLLNPYSIVVATISALQQLAATLGDFPPLYRILFAICCPVFVLIFEYQRQYEQKAWTTKSKTRRVGDLVLSAIFATWTQYVCWEPVLDLRVKIVCLVVPLGAAAHAQYRQRQSAAGATVDEVADEKVVQVEA